MNAACYQYSTDCPNLPYTGIDLGLFVFIALVLLVLGFLFWKAGRR